MPTHHGPPGGSLRPPADTTTSGVGAVRLDLSPADVHVPTAGAPMAAAKKTKKGALPTLSPKPKRGSRVHVRADIARGGSLSVRSLSAHDGSIHLEGVSISLADKSDTAPKWIQLAKPGKFKGHPAGPFELNDKVFKEIIANFKATANRRVAIDFEHASEMGATEGAIPERGAPAQGWIVDMKIEGGNLWGLVEWGALAREYILDGKYAFFSPAIRFNARDRVTGANIGARMTSGAMTNNPFLDGMMPLVASDNAANDASSRVVEATVYTMGLAHRPSEYMPGIRWRLRLNELATASECLEQLDRLESLLDEADGDPCGCPQGVHIADILYDLRDFLGARPGATWEDIFETVRQLVRAAGGLDDDNDGVDLTDDAEPTTLSAGESGQTGARAEEPTTMSQPNTSTTANADLAAEHTKTVTALAETKLALTDSTAKLTDATTKLSDVTTKLTASEAKTAELTLSLKEANGKVETLEAELKTLRDEKVKRDEQALTDRVNDAFETYKDSKKLTDDDKEAMLIVLKANPENFEKRYPKVAKNQQHLQHNLSDTREKTTPTTSDDAPTQFSVRAAAIKLSQERGIPLGDAQRIVAKNMSGASR